MLWWALWAALAMVAQDLLAVWLVQAEARGRATMAGLLDVIGWPMGMLTTFATVTAWQGHDGALKAAVVLSVSAANFVGTSIAVRVGQKRIKAVVVEAVCNCHCPVHPDLQKRG